MGSGKVEPDRACTDGPSANLIPQLFNVGTGLSDKQRRNPPKVGSIIIYRFQELPREVARRAENLFFLLLGDDIKTHFIPVSPRSLVKLWIKMFPRMLKVLPSGERGLMDTTFPCFIQPLTFCRFIILYEFMKHKATIIIVDLNQRMRQVVDYCKEKVCTMMNFPTFQR